MADLPSFASLERPLYGQFIRHLTEVETRELESCLQQQKEMGGRLGELLHQHGVISRTQLLEALANQARWVAKTMRSDIADGLPSPITLSLCMPAYNEADNIRGTLEAACAILPALVADYEIVVVDDGSRDGTADVVRRCADNLGRIRLIQHPQNRGYGAAVTTGLKNATGDLVMFTDSDGQFNLLDLPSFLAHVHDHEVVIGYRYNRADNKLRKMNAWAWTRLVRFVFGVAVHDLDCAFKLFRREVIDSLEPTSTGAAINAEIMMHCIQSGYRIKELPVTHYPCYFGEQTGARMSVILRAFKELRRLRTVRRTMKRAHQRPTPQPAGEPLIAAAASEPAIVAEAS